ncbi:MAG: molybdopterin-dependent oxidoreductase, partial [Pseudomonadota bacterium]
PVLFQRLSAAKAARPGMKVVNIDPRRTATSALADLHLAIAPGADVALFNRLLAAAAARGAVDESYVAAHVSGFDDALIAAQAGGCETGLDEADLRAFLDLWIETEKVVTVYSQGVNQSTSGADKVNAILNCHLATGRIGRPGMGPFSVTGQPNAMGGREVGGLSNMLAAHLDLEDAEHREAVRRFWRAPRVAAKPGLKAVDLFRACADGRIKALWILSTNPAVSMPDADRVAAAIAAVPFTVVSDMFADTDTARLAHVLLPAAGWGEKSGTVTNSDRTVSRQRAFLKPPGEARPDWRAISDVAAAMGWGAAFDYASPAEIFREHAALSAVAAGLGRDFDLSAFAGIDEDAYAAFEPARWPLSKARRGGRFFGEGGFFTPDRKARMLALTPRPLAAETTAERPFRLNTGRARDHWHTMTRTGRTPRLSRHIAEPYLEIHPADAARVGLRPAEIAEVSAPEGRFLARALVTERAAKGSVFAPMHWTGVYASAGRADAAVAAAVDPVSGQPELKGAAVAVARFPAAWHA